MLELYGTGADGVYDHRSDDADRGDFKEDVRREGRGAKIKKD